MARHVDLVYTAALRQVRDPATAEDVSQSVFMALATKAAGMRAGTIVPGWLVLTTRPIQIQQITTISRHKSDRGPQVYALYASDGATPSFDPAPAIGVDPATRGWTRLATVDTRPAAGSRGGTCAATITPSSGDWPRYRYLMFEMFPTETTDAFGDTFYSQIHVTEATGAPSVAGTLRP